MYCKHVVITGGRPMMLEILWEHMGGGSYWLAPLDCH